MREVDIQQFSEHLAEYIADTRTVSVLQNGQPVGYFFPVHQRSDRALAALKVADARVDALMEKNGIDIEEIAAEFDALRRAANGSGRRAV